MAKSTEPKTQKPKGPVKEPKTAQPKSVPRAKSDMPPGSYSTR